MTIFQAEIKYYLRSPIIWVIMALSAFISAWSFLLSIELFAVIQIKYAGISDAPTIMQGIIQPVIASQAKLLILIVSIIAGLSFARLNNNNGWALIHNSQQSEWHIIKQKCLAILVVSLMFVLPSIISVFSLAIIQGLELLPIFIALLGLLFLLLWMLALAMYISSLVSNTGFSILLSIVILMVFWMLSQSSLGVDWGKNWLQALSPEYHFQQFMTPYLSWSSLLYFISGTLLCLWAIRIRLIHKRYIL